MKEISPITGSGRWRRLQIPIQFLRRVAGRCAKWLGHGWSGARKREMFNWVDWPPEFTYSADPRFPHEVPNLRPHLCADTVSKATSGYNCIAWAASDVENWWEPDPFFQYHWPDGVQRNYSQQAYIDAFGTVGFEVCDNDMPEEGMEKIVLYTLRGEPKHAARRLRNGNWTSKLGGYEDIQHTTLDCLSGPLYGIPNVYLRRRIA